MDRKTVIVKRSQGSTQAYRYSCSGHFEYVNSGDGNVEGSVRRHLSAGGELKAESDPSLGIGSRL